MKKIKKRKNNEVTDEKQKINKLIKIQNMKISNIECQIIRVNKINLAYFRGVHNVRSPVLIREYGG